LRNRIRKSLELEPVRHESLFKQKLTKDEFANHYPPDVGDTVTMTTIVKRSPGRILMFAVDFPQRDPDAGHFLVIQRTRGDGCFGITSVSRSERCLPGRGFLPEFQRFCFPLACRRQQVYVVLGYREHKNT
jgi:hypothetical protein